MQRLGRRQFRDAQIGFSGGLNIQADRSALKPNELWTANEIRLNEIGGATKRGGTQRIHAAALTASPVRAGYSWLKAGTATEITVAGGSAYKLVYAIPCTPVLLGSGLSSTAQPSIASFVDGSGSEVCYIADGGLLNKTDGTTLTARIASTPNVAVIFTYNRRLYGVGDPANPDVLYFSALDNGDTLGVVASGGGSALIRTAGAKDLMLGHAIGVSLALIHRNSMSRWTGFTQDDIQVQSGVEGFSPDIGSTAPNSFVTNERLGVFLSDHGFYQMHDTFMYAIPGQSPLTPISIKIEPAIVALDHTQFGRVCGANSKATREMWWYLPDIGVYCYNYRFLDPDTGIGAWSGPWKGIFTSQVVYSMWSSIDVAGLPIVLAGFGDGFVRRLDAPGVYKDDVLSDGTGGTTISMQGTCARMFFQAPSHEKAFRKVWVTANLRGSANVGVHLQCDIGSASFTFPASQTGVWGKGKWGVPAKWGGIGTLTRKADLSGRGTYADISFTDSGTSNPVISRIEAQGFDYREM